MQILYLYIARRASYVLLFLVSLSFLIACLINLFDILKVVEEKNILTLELLKQYLFINLFPTVQLILHVMIVAVGIFATGELTRRREIEAMRAAGMKDSNILKPLMLIGVVISLTIGYCELEILPHLRQSGREMKEFLKHGKVTVPKVEHFYSRINNRALKVEKYDVEKNEYLGVLIERYDGAHVVESITGKELELANGEWNIIQGQRRLLDPATGQVTSFKSFEKYKYPSDIPRPGEFISQIPNPKERVAWLTAQELIDKRMFSARQEFHKRIAGAIGLGLACILGGWVGIRMERFNAARAISMSILIGFVYRLMFDGLLAVGIEFGTSWICHLANVFMVIGIILIF